MRLTLKTVPARQGLVWVREGLVEFFRHPLSYSTLLMAFMLAAGLVAALPVLGPILLMMGMPLLTLAYMMAVVGSQRGSAPRLAVYLVPWRQMNPASKRAMLLLCLSYALLNLLATTLIDLLDQGSFDALVNGVYGGENTSEEKLHELASAPGVVASAMARVTVTSLLSVPYWHAPALIHWGGQGLGQALFSSVLAMWRNKAAFLWYGLGWVGVMLGAATVGGLLLTALGDSALLNFLVMPIAVALTGAAYVSLFSTFRDSFGQPE